MEITRKELYELIWKKPISKLAEEWGIPGQALRAYCNQLNIPTPSSGYWSKLKFGKQVEIPPLPIFEGKEIQSFDSLQMTDKKNDKNNKEEELFIQKTEEVSIEPSLTISELTDSDKNKAIILEVPKDPRKKILFELQKMDQNLFSVPEVLYAKDPIIIDTKEFFRGERNEKYLYKNPYKSKIESPLNIQVKPENLNRALRIFSTIIRVLRLRGHQIIAKGYRDTHVIVDGEEFLIQLIEKTTKIENKESNYPQYIKQPSGKFKFEILQKKPYYTPKRVEDTSTTRLEDKIINIIAKIEYEAITIKEEREELERIWKKQEEERKKRELEEQKRKELEKKRKNEMRELKDAFLSAECYSISKTLREYVKKYESFLLEKGIIDDEDNEKLNWLKRKIDWLDPFIDYEDELLTEEDKQNLVFPESENDYHRTSYSSYNSYSAMAPRFTFWNNPFRRR